MFGVARIPALLAELAGRARRAPVCCGARLRRWADPRWSRRTVCMPVGNRVQRSCCSAPCS